VGELEDSEGVGELVVDVGDAEQLFLAEDVARRLAGRDDLAEGAAFVLVGAGAGEQVDDDRHGDGEQRQPALAVPDQT
jgi:hypothetical protein